MKTIYFHDYQKTGDTGYDLHLLMDSIKGQSDIKVVFDKGVYDVQPDYCFERSLCMSNHGWNGPKRIAVLIEDMQNIELDFSGSVLRVNGIMTAMAILGSSGVSIKNVTLENPATQILQTKVIGHGDGYIDLLKMHGKEQFIMRKDELVTEFLPMVFLDIWMHTEYDGETGEIAEGGGDNLLGIRINNEKIEDIGDDKIRLYGIKRYPPIGNIIMMNGTRRMGAGIFCEDSKNVLCENVTVHSCMGMGFTAQTSENITLRGFATRKHDGRYYTANADATHFIQCTGTVTVEDSFFECQLDDALNIHGMYTKIINKSDNAVFVREVHVDSKGIKIFRPGDVIQILKPDTVIPYTQKTISAVEFINSDTIRLELKDTTDDIIVGDVAENISMSADLLFRRNRVQNNRARGMLLASRGKTVIEDCVFHSQGVSIQFEANGEYWYESGGTQDVIIRNNFFDGCQYAHKKGPVIACVPRKNTEEGKYFHKKIQIIDNRFDSYSPELVHFDNVEHAVFKGNEIKGDNAFVSVYHVGKTDIDIDIK